MSRTTPEAVAEIISVNPRLAVGSFIAAAASLVEKLHAKDADAELSEEDLTIIETWLAAHFYAHRDQLLQSKSHGGASGSFQGQTAMLLSSTQYGQTAMLLDTTGYLTLRNQEATQGKATAGAIWLGVSPPDQGDPAGWV